CDLFLPSLHVALPISVFFNNISLFILGLSISLSQYNLYVSLDSKILNTYSYKVIHGDFAKNIHRQCAGRSQCYSSGASECTGVCAAFFGCARGTGTADTGHGLLGSGPGITTGGHCRYPAALGRYSHCSQRCTRCVGHAYGVWGAGGISSPACG